MDDTPVDDTMWEIHPTLKNVDTCLDEKYKIIKNNRYTVLCKEMERYCNKHYKDKIPDDFDFYGDFIRIHAFDRDLEDILPDISHNLTPKERKILEFLIPYEEKLFESKENEIKQDDSIPEDDKSLKNAFHIKVFQALKDEKIRNIYTNEQTDDISLRGAQEIIEKLSNNYYDIKNIHQSCPTIMNLMKGDDEDSDTALMYLHKQKLTNKEIELLSCFKSTSLEVLLICVLGNLFNALKDYPSTQVATLIDTIHSYIDAHCKIYKRSALGLINKKSSPEEIKTDVLEDANDEYGNVIEEEYPKNQKINQPLANKYRLGAMLVSFLVERKVLVLTNEIEHVNHSVLKKGGKYYIPKNIYATCNFNMELLPMKYDLPMICKPKKWKLKNKKKVGKRIDNDDKRIDILDLTGGYLLHNSVESCLHRYKLMSSKNFTNFKIYFGNDYTEFCTAMNKLQEQPFQINSDFLQFLLTNRKMLEKYNLLMPQHLSTLNVSKEINSLRVEYSRINEHLPMPFTFQELLREFMKRIQRSRYETFLFEIALAYEPYHLYLPAFLDFRGRIYRAGVLHFHERDLARSLLVFSNGESKRESQYINVDYTYLIQKIKQVEIICTAAAFHYRKFDSYQSAIDWYFKYNPTQFLFSKMDPNDDHYHDKLKKLYEKVTNFTYKEDYSDLRVLDRGLIEFSVYADSPFQFMSKVLCLKPNICTIEPTMIPITQDASASAYQIMSYFLIDREIAENTNLIPVPEKGGNEIVIKDIYNLFLNEITRHLEDQLETSLFMVMKDKLNRKLMKNIFMPIVYGKTVKAMSDDILEHFQGTFKSRESMSIACSINTFFKERFKGVVNLMTLVRSVSRLVSIKDRSVVYETPLLLTVQDYMKFQSCSCWVYDIHHKRRKVSLKMPTSVRDIMKTASSTFANFIHQKDANIAMFLIKRIKKKSRKIPLYTVHDNFFTNADNVRNIVSLYTTVITDGWCPLQYINMYIDSNLRKWVNNEIQVFGKVNQIASMGKEVFDESYFIRIYYYNNYNGAKGKEKTNIKKRWEKEFVKLIEAYTLYINTICDNEDERKGPKFHLDTDLILRAGQYVVTEGICPDKSESEYDAVLSEKFLTSEFDIRTNSRIFHMYKDNWNSFQKEIISWERFTQQYSLHH